MQEKHIIILIHITDRVKNAKMLQEVFTEYGCYIKTRLGLHEASETFCSTNGLIILELLGNEQKAEELENKVNNIEGLEAKKVVFDHKSKNMK